MKFLRRFIGINACVNLQRLSIITSTNIPDIAKTHDLVCIAVRDNLNNSEIANEISNFIAEKNGNMEPSIIRQIHLCYDQLAEENILRGNRTADWLTYSLLQLDGPVKSDIFKQLYSNLLTPDLSLASVMCIIDSKEIYSYRIEDKKLRDNYYKECADEYKNALEMFSSQEVKGELLHHQGKALRRCGEYEPSLKCFEALLELKADLYAAHGQIAHLGIQKNASRDVQTAGEKSMIVLIESLKEGKKLPLRVALASLSRLRSYTTLNRNISKNSKDVETFGEIIAMSALEKFGQFYEAFVAFTSMFSFQHSALCIKLAETLSEMLINSPNLVEKDQWISACETLSNLSVAAQRENKDELAKQLINASLLFADEFILELSLKSYDARAVAKAYLIASFPRKALQCISKVHEDKVDHWLLYRKCEAELLCKLTDDALETATKALTLAQSDPKGITIISIYHDIKSKSHEALNDIRNAVKELENAIEKCIEPKYKNPLEDRLKTLNSKK